MSPLQAIFYDPVTSEAFNRWQKCIQNLLQCQRKAKFAGWNGTSMAKCIENLMQCQRKANFAGCNGTHV
jgi:hypothetical protein